MQCCEVESGGWSSKSAQVRRGCLKKLHREGRKHPGIAQHSVEGWLDPQVPVAGATLREAKGRVRLPFPPSELCLFAGKLRLKLVLDRDPSWC